MSNKKHEEVIKNTVKKEAGNILNKLDQLFTTKSKSLLNIFFTAGYPDVNSTTEVILSLQQQGADIIEIGMPYSDPIADGPVIQESNMIALQNGMTMELLFHQLNTIKESVQVPLILMGYLNPVMQYGMEKFCADAAAAGVHGIILPDLPMFEFEHYYKSIFEKHQLHFVFLITPETSFDRIKKADILSSGFLYAVSSSATTGSSADNSTRDYYFERLAALKLKNPLLIGFGINDNRSFENACKYASGAIIGSAYIKILQHSRDINRDTGLFIRSITNKHE